MNWTIKNNFGTPETDAPPQYESEAVNDFLNAFGKPVREFERTKFHPDVEESEEIPEAFHDPDSFKSDLLDDFFDVNSDSAELLVEVGSGFIAFVLAKFVAKNDNVDNYRLPDREIAKLTKLTAKLVPKHKPMISPGMLFFITLASAYTPIVSSALKDRKIAELEAEIQEMKRNKEKKVNEQEDEQSD